MSAIAEGAIHDDMTGLGREQLEDLGDHDGTMRAGGSFAGGDDLGDGVRMESGLMLLVFFLKPARIFSRVTHPTFVGCGRRRSRGFVGHKKRLP